MHFEIDDEDAGVTGSEASPGQRKRGYAKNGRGDAPQVVVGLAVTRDGLPVRHWVFPGNTVDVSTVSQVKADLKGWNLGRCVFVGDAGTVSASNLRTLSLSGGKYIVCMPVHHGGADTSSATTRKKSRASAVTVSECSRSSKPSSHRCSNGWRSGPVRTLGGTSGTT